MKKIMILLAVSLIFFSCQQGVVPYEITTEYTQAAPVATPAGETTEETKTVKMLTPIDESKEYIFDQPNRRIYLADDLPDGTGQMAPTPFTYDNGTYADVIDFIYDVPTREWYIKVADMIEVKTDGLTTGWEPKERIFKQKDGKVVESELTMFPGYNPEGLKPLETGADIDLVYEILSDGAHIFFRPHNQDQTKCSNFAGDWKIVTWYRVVGDTLWVIGSLKDVGKPQIFTIDEGGIMATRRMDDAKAVFKPKQ